MSVCIRLWQLSVLLWGARVSDALPVLVLGDSRAEQLNLFFDHVGERTGKRFRVISASSCVMIPGFDVDRLPDYSRQDCRNWIEYAKRFLPESSEIWRRLEIEESTVL